VKVAPIASPPDNWYTPAGAAFPVTVRVGGASISEMYPTPGVQQKFLLRPCSDATVTVTVVLSDSYPVPGLAFGFGHKSLLTVSGPFSLGTNTFTLHLGNLAPGRDQFIGMTVWRP
jgi:hypothetical protein